MSFHVTFGNFDFQLAVEELVFQGVQVDLLDFPLGLEHAEHIFETGFVLLISDSRLDLSHYLFELQSLGEAIHRFHLLNQQQNFSHGK